MCKITVMQNKQTTTRENIALINSIDVQTNRLSLKKMSQNDVEPNVAHEMDTQIMRYIRDPLSLKEPLIY
ncbi:MAG: hypothetical protein L3J53_08535 [Proteobacteria bacterium]|nr:hypothetical protein [Pseudomonadota bacterium]